MTSLVEQIRKTLPDLPNARWVALRLLDGDTHIAEALRKGDLGELGTAAAASDVGPAGGGA